MTQTLRLGIFSANVVAAWAEEHGVFAEHGLVVEQVPVASSPAQFTSLSGCGAIVLWTRPTPQRR